jgi:hypothetical protein
VRALQGKKAIDAVRLTLASSLGIAGGHRTLTAAMIDSRDFLAAKRTRSRLR